MTSLHSSCCRGRASPGPCSQSQSSTPGESVPPAFLKTALTAWDSPAALAALGSGEKPKRKDFENVHGPSATASSWSQEAHSNDAALCPAGHAARSLGL